MNELFEALPPEVVRLLRRVVSLTPLEVHALGTPLRDPGLDIAFDVAYDAVYDAARQVPRDGDPGLLEVVTQFGALDVALDAAFALSARGLIGSRFTHEHYATLLSPWEDIMGTHWTR